MLTKMKIALALCATLAGGVALADGIRGGGGEGRGKMLEKYDTNKDGVLDANEKAAMKADFQAKREARKQEMLAKYDTNKDGKLDETERAAMKDARATERFQKMDLNKDGVISLDEFKQAAGKFGPHARGRFGRHHHKAIGTK
jgi:Ca2+-binding EF-hand superfamily protein